MAPTIALLIVFSGLFSSCHCEPAQYHFESRLLNWTEAQNYCREKVQSDLVTITSQEDNARFNEYVQQLGYSGGIWIGLYNDVNSWKWSMDDLSLGDTGYELDWGGGQPDNNNGEEACVCLTNAGIFNRRACFAKFFFLCYNDEEKEYVRITERTNWIDARTHCRRDYTDLASVRSQEEYERVKTYLTSSTRTWIGLSRGIWKWSDQNPSTFRAWVSAPPSKTYGTHDCASYEKGAWRDNVCSKEMAFVCNRAPRSQVVRIAIKMDSPANMEDPAIQAALAEQIRQKLQENGQPVGRVYWKSQPDGKVFHQQKSEQTKKHREKRSEL